MEPSEDEVSAAISKAFQLPSVKPEQLQVVVSALKRQDVLLSYPQVLGRVFAFSAFHCCLTNSSLQMTLPLCW